MKAKAPALLRLSPRPAHPEPVEGPDKEVKDAAPLIRHPGLDPGSTFPLPALEGRRWIPDKVRNDEEAASCAVPIWDRAFARFNEAQAVASARSEPDQDAYLVYPERLPWQAVERGVLETHSDALNALRALPAPDLPALAAKPCPERSRRIDVIVPQQALELTGSEDCLEILRRDASGSPPRPSERLARRREGARSPGRVLRCRRIPPRSRLKARILGRSTDSE